MKCECNSFGKVVYDIPKDPDMILSLSLYFPQSLNNPGGRLSMSCDNLEIISVGKCE
jgi:hypothetical protein